MRSSSHEQAQVTVNYNFSALIGKLKTDEMDEAQKV
jgi:hypothetical protein